MIATGSIATSPTPSRSGDLPWLDRMKALALLWVVFNHIVEAAVGGASAGNLSDPWPPLSQRIAELGLVHGVGLLALPLTFLRDLAWFGDQGVTVLFLVSGFGLAYGAAGKALDVRRFYTRRLGRIYPSWWAAHLLFWPSGFIIGWGLFSGDWRFYVSLLGVRAWPALFYYFSPAWWYVGTLIQIYLLFPLLYRFALARGSRALVLGACASGFAALAAGPAFARGDFLDLWQRGAIAITRLPEFSLGIALGLAWRTRGAELAAALRSPLVLAAAAAAYAAGTVLSVFVLGEAVAPFVLGASASVAIFALSAGPASKRDSLGFIGRHSYAIYLVHHPFVQWFVAREREWSGHAVARFAAGAVAALVATAVASVALERVTAFGESLFVRLRKRRGTALAAATMLGAFVLIVVIVPVSADVAVARFAPEEVFGWGERASLEPDPDFGWKMRPGATTHLRWVTYDYTVTANSLGFPGPEFPERKVPGTLRILVTGDAFSSAEGVDTRASWPRLLQNDLAHDLGRPVEVLDFAITGYGPKQEAAVVRAFAPRYRPDVVLVEMFANDVGDALLTDDQFRDSIGFAYPPPTGLKSILELQQLRASIAMRLVEPLKARLRERPTPEGVELGTLAYVATAPGGPDYDGAGVARTIAAYRSIDASARAAGAKTYVAFVPPSVTVCEPSDLAYLPASLDLTDRSSYDRELPAKRATRVYLATHIPFFDLTPGLRAQRPCAYAKHNMHFTPATHVAVAKDLAARLEAALKR